MDDDRVETTPHRSPEADATPAANQVYDFLLYGLSLPERALRTTSAVVGGAIAESAALLLPQAFRTSKSYNVFVEQMLDFMVHDVGRVEQPQSATKESEVEAYVARKAVGSFIDLAGLATLHLSPLTVLAVASDVAYGSQVYLKELSDELKKAGVIDEESTIDHAADLLDAVGQASSTTADAFDTPPVSVEGLKETIEQTTQAVRSIDPSALIPEAEIDQIWQEIHEIATRDGVGLTDVSSAVSLFAIGKIGTLGHGALSTVKVTGNMFDRHIFAHYREGLAEIRARGFYRMFAAASAPYIDAVWLNFASERATVTEDLLKGKLLGQAWGSVLSWFDKPTGDSGKNRSSSSDQS